MSIGVLCCCGFRPFVVFFVCSCSFDRINVYVFCVFVMPGTPYLPSPHFLKLIGSKICVFEGPVMTHGCKNNIIWFISLVGILKLVTLPSHRKRRLNLNYAQLIKIPRSDFALT